MIAGKADDRTVSRQVGERRVERLDHCLLPSRILRMPRGVRALDVAEHERVSRVEPFLRKRDPAAQIGCGILGLGLLARSEADGTRKPAEERRARDEGPAQAVPLLERRNVALPPPPLE